MLLGLRDAAMALINAERESIDDTTEIHDLRDRLNRDYDAYSAAHGPINRCAERRQLRPAWHVFSGWCERHDRPKLPTTAETVRDYLSDLHHRGLGRDLLQRHLDAIADAHTTAHNRQLARAITKFTGQGGADGQADERQEALARHLATTDPEGLLHATSMDDLRLPADALTAGQQVLAAAPARTSPELDLDALGLRTTVVLRPPQGGFRTDPFANVVRALERFDPTTQTARKAAIFTQRVINPPRTRLGADTPEEALSICLDTHSRVDLPEIARLLGLPDPQQARAVLGELVYDDPDTGEPIWARQYLAGNVRQKLARATLAAEQDLRFAVNVAALERVVPADLGPQDIEIRLGSWIGPSYVQQFLRELLDDPTVRVEHAAGMWHVSGKGYPVAATELWGGGGLDAYQLTERLLVGSEIRVMRTVEAMDANGRMVEQQVLDAQATEEAKDKARELGDRFADWVWEDSTRAQALITQYNDAFNAEIPPDFGGVELSLPGLSLAFTLREHQKTAVARIVYQPATGLVHEVGAGKTLEMIVGVMERRRRGLVSKPAIVVPNDSIAEQFEREWLQAYPSARLLTATSADLAGRKGGRDRRAEFVARVATGDWDAVIMTKEAFQRIPLHPEAQERFLHAELDALKAAKTDNAGSMSQTMTKRLETAVQNAEERLKTRLAGIDRDVAGVTLRDSGIDFVVVDEAQNFKNGMVASSLPGLAIEGADRSIDLDMKLAWLAETHGSPRVVLATATPFTNTFSEIYLWLRRLGHQLPAFDTWARTYCTSETFMEMTPGGNLRAKTRMRRVINEPELWQSLRLTSDIKMKDDLDLPTPRLRGDRVEIITVPAPVEARVFTLDLARRERQLSGRPERGADNHLVIQHDGQLAALDVRTVGLHTDQPQKVDHLADDIHTEWHAARNTVYYREDGTKHPVCGGLILVFCDESTPGKGWNFYTQLRQQLVARGMDERSIRFIHEATSPQRKADLLAACREGAVSVLVGSTMKMGAGINVQTRAIGGYEITGPWRPDIPAQARGRVERQGNQNDEFFWKRVVTSPSMDAKKWEITHQKHGMFAPLYASTAPSRTREVHDDQSVGLADVMAAATGDPRYREKAELDQEYNALRRQRSAHLRTQQSLKLLSTSLTGRIPELDATAQRQDAVAARRIDTRGDQFRMSIKGGRTYTKRSDAADALKQLLTTAVAAAPRTPQGETIPVGSLGGYEITATLQPLRDLSILLAFPDAAENTSGVALDHRSLPERHGIITRLEHQLDLIATAGDRTRELIEEERRNLDQARSGIGRPFPHENRLAEVAQRRAELITELSADPDQEPDARLDPDSPEAKARAARAETRQRDRQELFDAAHQTAMLHSAGAKTAAAFATWYVEITAPATAEQRPPADTAFTVWRDLGRPTAHGDGKAPPRPTALPASTPYYDTSATVPTAMGITSTEVAATADEVPAPPASDPPTAPPIDSADLATPSEPPAARPVTDGASATSPKDTAERTAEAPKAMPPAGESTRPKAVTEAASPAPAVPARTGTGVDRSDDAGRTGDSRVGLSPPDDPQADTTDPSPAQEGVLVIEHNHSGTLVHGTSQHDVELHKLLRDNTFKYSRRLNAWYLGRQQRFDTRSFRVRRLCTGLEQAGRQFELRRQETMATADTVTGPLPAADPFTSADEAVAAARITVRAYRQVDDTQAGARMLGGYSSRPDGQALTDAAHAVLSASKLHLTPQQLLDAHNQLYRAAAALHTNLHAERKRAPVLMARLADLVERSRQFAARLTATLEHGTLNLADTELLQAPPAQPTEKDRTPRTPPPAAPPASEPASAERRIQLDAEINAAAAHWFEAQLVGSADAEGYLRGRWGSLDPLETMRARGFCVGYAPPGWTQLTNHLRAAGYRDQDFVNAGLAVPGRRSTLTDRFRNRIMFGIRDAEGRIAGFIGRALSDQQHPKYLNNPATALFDKGSLVLGLFEQRDLAEHADPVFVEGPFDIAAILSTDPQQRLLPVAPCGTALTTHHLDAVDTLIAPERRRVLALDGDPAGQAAALTTAQVALRRYPNLHITTLPDGLDPADWARTAPADERLTPYLDPPHCRPALDVLVDARLQTWADRLHWAEGRVGAARDLARLLAIADPHRAAGLAVDLATRLDLDPLHMAEYIATERHRAGEHTALPDPAAQHVLPAELTAANGQPADVTTATEPAQHPTIDQESDLTAAHAEANHEQPTPDGRGAEPSQEHSGATDGDAQFSLWDQADPGPSMEPPANVTGNAAHATTETTGTVDTRLVTLAANATEPTWFFTDDGATTPLAAPLPDVPVTSRGDLIKYVLGDHARDKETRTLVSILLSGRSRNGVHVVDAQRRLAHHDQDLYRRALAVTAGQGRRGQPFDIQRAKLALVRLAEGDPTLPLNTLGHYAELVERDPEPDRIPLRGPTPTRTVRGVVIGVEPAPHNRLTVIIERDVPSVTGAERARQDFPTDGTVPLLDPETRPTAEERQAAKAAIQPAIQAHKRALGIDWAAPGPQREYDWPTSDPDELQRPDATQDSHGDEQPTANDLAAQHWALLVATAAEHGFSVQTSYDGASSIDSTAHTIAVAHNRAPFNRVSELAQLVGAAAVRHAEIETAPVEQSHATDTPIYDSLCRELHVRSDLTNHVHPLPAITAAQPPPSATRDWPLPAGLGEMTYAGTWARRGGSEFVQTGSRNLA